MRRPLVIGILAALAAASSERATAQAPQWGPAPAIFPAGARMAVLQGDPSKPGPITIRLDMPDGYTIAPHFHPTDEAVTVLGGTFLIGMGDSVDLSKTLTLTVGGFGVAPAGHHHFAVARGRTTVQVNLVGPFAMTYVNPADDPTRQPVARK